MKKNHGAKVWVTNHVMAKRLVNTQDGVIVQNPIVDFVGINTANSFNTLDHFLCKRGNYTVFMRIVHVASGAVVQAVEPFMISAKEDWYTYAYTIGWNYDVHEAGVYEYQILANGDKIGAFRFFQHEKGV